MILFQLKYIIKSLVVSIAVVGLLAGVVSCAKPDNKAQKSNKSVTQNENLPQWVRNCPSDNDNLYAVGIAEPQNSLRNQKKFSELLAKRDVAAQVRVHVQSTLVIVKRTASQNGANETNTTDATMLIDESVDLVLKDVKIVANFHNPVDGRYYSLAQVPKPVKNQ